MALKYLYAPSGVQAEKAYGVLPNSANADFSSFSRSSAGSRVDKNGLIDTGLGLGGEEIVNGDFDTDSDWIKQDNWQISNGKANTSSAITTTAWVYQLKSNTYDINKVFEISADIVVNSGSCELGIGSAFGSSITESGTYSFTLTMPANHTFAGCRAQTGFEGSVDNISVREVTEVNTDVPRLDYTGGGCPSLLLEPQSSNLITYSEDLNNTNWSNSELSVTSDYSISPDGTQNASLLIPSTSNQSDHRLQVAFSTIPIINNFYTFSVFVKGNDDYKGVTINLAASRVYANFDIENGVVLSTYSNGTAANQESAKIEKYPNGWFRLSLSVYVLETRISYARIIPNKIASEYNQNGQTYAGDGVNGLEVFGVSWEQQPYATSYIPNYGTAAGVTRSQDVSGYTGDISVDIDSEEGVFFAEIAYFDADQQGFPHMSISDGTADNRISIQKQSSTTNAVAFTVRDSNVGQCFLQESTIDKSNYFKIAGKYKQDDFALFINGNKINTDTGGSVPTGLNTFSFDKGNTFSKFFGRVRQIRIYDEVLSDNELEELTTL